MEHRIFNPLEHPICLDFPHWLAPSAWTEHIPFGMYLVSVVKPVTIVELGTYGGTSYCSFCQAVKTLRLGSRCYAVDTWQGDAHAGEIDEAVLKQLREHHDPLYGAFSTLIRSIFADAVEHFADKSIDLLHIDGLHTYEAVRNDFESWLPKISDRGIILFHDINERRDDFGAWRFWEEARSHYPFFEFMHGHGLGILAPGTAIPSELDFLFEPDERAAALIRKFFFALGRLIEATRSIKDQNARIKDQSEYIEVLKTYETTVQSSHLLRGYRAIREKGLINTLRKAVK